MILNFNVNVKCERIPKEKPVDKYIIYFQIFPPKMTNLFDQNSFYFVKCACFIIYFVTDYGKKIIFLDLGRKF